LPLLSPDIPQTFGRRPRFARWHELHTSPLVSPRKPFFRVFGAVLFFWANWVRAPLLLPGG